MPKSSIPTDLPPPYSDAVDIRDSFLQTTYGSISDRVANVRTRNLIAVVENKIVPVLRRRAEQGLSKSSIALIPSDIKEAVRSGKIIGLPTGCDDAEQVQLEGELNRREFWCQVEVTSELQVLIEAVLASDNSPLANRNEKSQSDERAQFDLQPVPTVVPASTVRSRSIGSLFGRKALKPNERGAAVEPATVKSDSKRQNPVLVNVFQDEICLRTISDFGLYETVTKAVIMVQIKVI